MKHLLVFLTAIAFILTDTNNTVSAQTNTNSKPVNKQLQELLNQKKYFSLDAQFNLLKRFISKEQQLYFQSYLDNAFNKNEQVINDVTKLFRQFSSHLSDSSKVGLYQLMDDSYFKLFEYAKAASIDSIIINNYATAIDADKLSDIKNNLTIRNALKNILPQKIYLTHNTTIQGAKDKIGVVEIPVRNKDTTYDAIFDTRANISTISQTYAAKLGIRLLPVVYNEGSGITGIQFNTGLGIADSMFIGDILVRNAVFQVLPDSVLYIAPIDFRINIIIGLPIIAQLKEVHLYKNGKVIIPLHTTTSTLHNLALDGLDPVLLVKHDKDTLSFDFDSGASSSVLYYAYFKKYQSFIVKRGIKKSSNFEGVGGVQKKDIYVLPSINLFLGNTKASMDSIDVLTQKIYPSEKLYGNLGQDFIRTFDELMINFEDMYIKAL